MRTIIIVQNNVPLKCDLSLIASAGDHYRLISSHNAYAETKEDFKNIFEKTYLTDDMSLSSLSEIIGQIIKDSGNNEVLVETADESNILALAKIREAFHLRGSRYDEMLRFVNKIIMKDVLDAHNIRTPKYQKFNKKEFLKNGQKYLDNLCKHFAFPLIHKPIDQCGSAGVRKITHRNEFDLRCQDASQSKIEYQIEEYISGKLYHCNSIIRNGENVHTAVDEYVFPVAFFAQGKNLGCITLLDSDPVAKKIMAFNNEALKALNPPDGMTHLEVFISDKNDELVFLEIGARPPGGLASEMYEKLTKINFFIEHFKAKLYPKQPMATQQKILEYNSWNFIPKKPGIVTKLIQPSFFSRYQLDWNIKVGDAFLPSLLNGNDIIFDKSEIAGVLYLYNSNYDELYKDFEALREIDFVEVQE